ncbi:MAG: Sporulation related domain [Acidobacteria bacterium]|nr:Sporulation related domain [Acidobacteriota bacterium]
MESTEPREPSYYEVALTHRQVLVAFVVLLTCLLAAFLSGVWVGREAAPASRVAAAPAPAAAPAAPPIEQLTFFSGKEPGARGPARAEAPAPKPAAPAVKAAEDPATETMRKTLEAEMEAHREVGPEAATAPVAPPLAAGERVRKAGEPAPPATARTVDAAATPAAPAVPAPAPAAKPAAPAPAAAGSTWIQVYSSTNGARAREIADQLRKARFQVVVAEVAKDGQTAWRVRVGPYPTRAKADAAATRLRREQKLDTWVTDSP